MRFCLVLSPQMTKTLNRQEYKIIIEILYKVRVNAGLRQEDLANKLGVPQSFISKTENCDRRLDIIELRDICNALDISVADVMTRLETELNETKQQVLGKGSGILVRRKVVEPAARLSRKKDEG